MSGAGTSIILRKGLILSSGSCYATGSGWSGQSCTWCLVLFECTFSLSLSFIYLSFDLDIVSQPTLESVSCCRSSLSVMHRTLPIGYWSRLFFQTPRLALCPVYYRDVANMGRAVCSPKPWSDVTIHLHRPAQCPAVGPDFTGSMVRLRLLSDLSW